MISWFKRMYRQWKWEHETDWNHVPSPNWASSRRKTGGYYW
jgi:hypothetical protein